MHPLPPELFVPIADETMAREVFRRTVSEVQVEISSFCNRRCPYCPVSLVDRHSANHRIDDGTFERILADLAAIGYDRRVGLSLYNEPLGDPRLEERIVRARRDLPRALIYFYSNGDYLTAEMLTRLAAAGLDEITVSIHPAPGKPYADTAITRRAEQLARRLGSRYEAEIHVPDAFQAGRIPFPGIRVHVTALDYRKHGQDRGGLLPDLTPARPRRAPCSRPFTNFVVDNAGLVLPCCQIFSDHPEHAPYIVGRLEDFPSIFQAYCSAPLAAWRRDLFLPEPRRAPCATCTDGDREVPAEEAALRARFMAMLGLPGG
jgi:hypothetical protein